MTPSLQQAIEGVYEIFCDVPRPHSVDACPCCIDRKGIVVLLSKPLRKLSPDDLTNYASSVFLTSGAVEDFLYFIPRILEILASESDWWPSPEVVTQAMHSADFETWPESRRQAVLTYFDEVVAQFGSEGTGHALDSWICALGTLHVKLEPFLDRVAAQPRSLIKYYEANSEHLVEGGLSNAFWDEAPEERKQVIDWFRSEGIRKSINLAYGLE